MAHLISIVSQCMLILENGPKHSLYGWVRITDPLKNSSIFQLLSYRSLPLGSETLDKAYSQIFNLSYSFTANSSDAFILEYPKDATTLNKTVYLYFNVGAFRGGTSFWSMGLLWHNHRH